MLGFDGMWKDGKRREWGRKNVIKRIYIKDGNKSCSYEIVTKYNNKKSKMNVLIFEFAKKIQIWLTKQVKESIVKEEINLKGANTMILEFTCTNHKSIKDKVGFSFVASSDSTYDENLREEK